MAKVFKVVSSKKNNLISSTVLDKSRGDVEKLFKKRKERIISIRELRR